MNGLIHKIFLGADQEEDNQFNEEEDEDEEDEDQYPLINFELISC